jgi:CRP-like cAMP-binding protein
MDARSPFSARATFSARYRLGPERAASVTAMEPTRLLLLERDAFYRLVGSRVSDARNHSPVWHLRARTGEMVWTIDICGSLARNRRRAVGQAPRARCLTGRYAHRCAGAARARFNGWRTMSRCGARG